MKRKQHRKIPIISLGLIFVQKAFSVGLFLGTREIQEIQAQYKECNSPKKNDRTTEFKIFHVLYNVFVRHPVVVNRGVVVFLTLFRLLFTWIES